MRRSSAGAVDVPSLYTKPVCCEKLPKRSTHSGVIGFAGVGGYPSTWTCEPGTRLARFANTDDPSVGYVVAPPPRRLLAAAPHCAFTRWTNRSRCLGSVETWTFETMKPRNSSKAAIPSPVGVPTTGPVSLSSLPTGQALFGQNWRSQMSGMPLRLLSWGMVARYDWPLTVPVITAIPPQSCDVRRKTCLCTPLTVNAGAAARS